MSSRNRNTSIASVALVALALAVWSLAIWSLASQHSYRTRYTEYATGQNAEDARHEIETVCARETAPSGYIECVERVATSERSNRRAYDDLQAQQDMAQWAFVLMGITALQAFIGGVGLYLLVGTFRQTAESVRLARQTYIAEHRTWLKVTPTKDIGPVQHDNGKFRFQGEFKVKNVGKEPATDVRIFAEPFVGKGHFPGEDLMMKVVNLERAIAFGHRTNVATTLLQDEEAATIFTGDFHADATLQAKADAAIASGVLPRNLPLTLSVIFGVVYRSAVDPDRICHSAHVLTLVRKDNRGFEEFATSSVYDIRTTVIFVTSSVT